MMFKKNNISIYKDTKRNEKCPCGSGKIFKKCCMKEYREREKFVESAIFSTFSPIQPLSLEDIKIFQKVYDDIILSVRKHKKYSKFDYDYDEREILYKNRTEILNDFQKNNILNGAQNEIVEALREAKYDLFALCEYSDRTAVVVDSETNAYNVQALITDFTNLFKEKNVLFYTTLISYKNRYILDGYYIYIEIGQDTISEMKKLPSYGLEMNFQKKKKITFFPVSINLCLFTNALHYEKMEKIVLEHTSKEFTQNILNLFQDTPFESKFLVSSLIRSIDFLYYTDKDALNKVKLLSGLPVSNFEKNGNNSVIPYDILKSYYQQNDLDKSMSKDISKNIKYAKELVARGEENILQASSFYTMFGVFYIDNDKINNFDFLTPLRDENGRKAFTQIIEKYFDEINRDLDLDITPVYLDFGLDYDDIIDEIDAYRESKGSLYKWETIEEIRRYSIYKGRK